jgi:hypothetical protein
VTPEVLSPLTALVPLGISPFLALGLFGAAARYTGFVLPPSLGVLAHPAVWGGLLALAVLLKVGRSLKLTKPFAEMAGTTESLAAMVTFAMMILNGHTAAAAGGPIGLQEASVLGTTALVLAAGTGLAAVTLVRMGLDLLTWLSPIPLIDAALQLAKLVVTAVLVAVAIFFPALAVPVNVALLFATVLASRWLLRVTRFAVAVLWDRAVGTFDQPAVAVVEDGVGPVPAWVVSARGQPRHTGTRLRWSPDAGWTARPGEDWADGVELGASAEASLTRGFMGTMLLTPRGRFFLTARYGRAVEAMAARSGTPLRGGSAPPAMRMRTI